MHTGTGLAGAGQSGLEDRELRQLALAVLASLVLHALVLLVLASVTEFARSRAAPPPLTARLAKPKPPPPPLEKIEPVVPVPVPLPSPRTPVQPKAAPQAPAPAPAAPILSLEPAKKAEEPAVVVPVAPPQAAPRIEPRTEPVAASGPDPASVARYRLELMEIARRYKRYPRIALDNNWEGRVELRIGFSESGAMTLLSVKKGAGRAVLDEEAQAMIRSAQAQATIPPALRGKAFTIEIPVDFFLKDAR